MSENPRVPRDDIGALIAGVIEELSGESLAAAEPGMSFLAMGFDSLFLGQVAQRLQQQTKVKITFRQLLGEQSSIDKLAAFLAERMPAPVVAQPLPAPAAAQRPDGMEALFRDQMDAMKALFDRQLDTLRQTGQAVAPAPVPAAAIADEATPSRFQAYRAGAKSVSTEPTPAQRAHIEALSTR